MCQRCEIPDSQRLMVVCVSWHQRFYPFTLPVRISLKVRGVACISALVFVVVRNSLGANT